jgi:TctA family transporter
VGLSAVHTQARFTFGLPELYEGINFIPAMIGLFGVSEVLKNLEALARGQSPEVVAAQPAAKRRLAHVLLAPITQTFIPACVELKRRVGGVLRSSAIGTAIGMLPGAGADIASWVSMAVAKRLGKKQCQGEDASLDGFAEATTANNSALAGAWIPALVFGIPGDSVTAIVIGVLLMKNVKPGPEIFEQQSAIKAGGYVVRVPQRILLPIILLACVVGSYAISERVFDIWIMLAMGVVGFVLERWQVPIGPVVLGIVLGGQLEEKFIQTLTGADGSPLAFFDRPLSAVLGAAAIALWTSLLFFRGRKGADGKKAGTEL